MLDVNSHGRCELEFELNSKTRGRLGGQVKGSWNHQEETAEGAFLLALHLVLYLAIDRHTTSMV